MFARGVRVRGAGARARRGAGIGRAEGRGSVCTGRGRGGDAAVRGSVGGLGGAAPRHRAAIGGRRRGPLPGLPAPSAGPFLPRRPSPAACAQALSCALGARARSRRSHGPRSIR